MSQFIYGVLWVQLGLLGSILVVWEHKLKLICYWSVDVSLSRSESGHFYCAALLQITCPDNYRGWGKHAAVCTRRKPFLASSLTVASRNLTLKRQWIKTHGPQLTTNGNVGRKWCDWGHMKWPTKYLCSVIAKNYYTIKPSPCWGSF
jgi:hypothetical protein